MSKPAIWCRGCFCSDEVIMHFAPARSCLVLSTSAAEKFDSARANEYQTQSRIALAGYDVCHELAACMLSATLASNAPAHILVVGAGGGAQEIVTASVLGPQWRFTTVDPSQPMMDIAIER